MSQYNYPFSNALPIKETHFGVDVEDPYRWMEDENAPELKQWIDAQCTFTEAYLNQFDQRPLIEERLKTLYNYPKYRKIQLVGKRIIFSYNSGLQPQPVYYVQEGEKGEKKILLDPNTLSKDGTVAVTLESSSYDNRYIALLESDSGSDWQSLKVIDLETNQLLPDCLKGVKFTHVAWYGDGFFYSRYAIPEKGKELSAKNENMAIYYHRLGSPQEEDLHTFSDPENPLRYYTMYATRDMRFLILSISEGTYGSAIWIKDLRECESPAEGEFKPVFDQFDGEAQYVGSRENLLFFISDRDAMNRKIITVNAETLMIQDLIPEKPQRLENCWKFGDQLVLIYLKDVLSWGRMYDLNGNHLGDIELEDMGMIYDFTGDQESEFLYFTYGSFVVPMSIMRLDRKTIQATSFLTSELPYNVKDFTTERIFCKSKDGTLVPVFLTYKRGLQRDRSRPTLLYAYGGFNASLPPFFSPANIYLADQGGIYAQANLRGGGEYGESWHKAGMLLNKQNVFDDFIAVAETLIALEYTSPEHLSVLGASNGGLLMGAVVNQRPELFHSVFAAVGVMDMLRYHLFTIGWGWAVEYGNPEEEIHFHNIYCYSPLHNIEEKKYPRIMVMTADHDDRVVPAHSFKYIATLQAKNTSHQPMLIRIDKNAGHGAGKSIAKIISEDADIFAFMQLDPLQK